MDQTIVAVKKHTCVMTVIDNGLYIIATALQGVQMDLTYIVQKCANLCVFVFINCQKKNNNKIC